MVFSKKLLWILSVIGMSFCFIASEQWYIWSSIKWKSYGVWYPVAKLTPDPPPNDTTVLVLSYQRCGSSFMGRLFGFNPDAFYFFEPDDAVYMRMYGTAPGWSVPSDIFTHSNGTLRTITPDESLGLAEIARSLLLCNHNELPVELLTHKYLYLFGKEQPNLKALRQCVNKQNITVDSCYGKSRINKVACPTRFSPDKQDVITFCKKHLYDESMNSSTLNSMSFHSERTIKNATERLRIMHDFRKCKDAMSERLKVCSHISQQLCNSSKIKSIKTVRMTMETVGRLLEAMPHLKVVHLFRDPWPVVLSRSKNPSFKGMRAGSNLTTEASMYCARVFRDIQIRKQLQTRFPDSFIQVLYDDFVKDTVKGAKIIYNFIGREIHNETLSYFSKNYEKSKAIAGAWKEKLNYTTYESISEVCKDMLLQVHGSPCY